MTFKNFLFLGFLLLSQVVWAFDPPSFTPNVVDEAAALSADEVKKINERIQTLQQNAQIYTAVYFTKTLGEVPIEDAAYQTFRKWQLGTEEESNGLLLVFAIDDRNARIEVGSGLEGDITDLHAKRLLDNVILPHFKSGEFATGVLNGLEAAALIKTKQPLPEDLQVFGKDQSLEIVHKRAFVFYMAWLFILFGLVPCLIFLESKSAISNKAKVILINNKYTLVEPDVPLGFFQKANKEFNRSKFFTYLFLTIFFAINPGAFVYVLAGLDEVYVPVSKGFAMMQESSVLYFWLSFVFLMPAALKTGAIYYGRLKGNRNPNCHRPFLKNIIYFLDFNKMFNVLGKLAVFFISGFIYAILIANQLPVLGTIVLCFFSGIMGLGELLLLTPLISEKSYKKRRVMRRWNRIRNRATGKREIFGKVYSFPVRSSSSGGGFSSSSGGGRSSGGGASSSW